MQSISKNMKVKAARDDGLEIGHLKSKGSHRCDRWIWKMDVDALCCIKSMRRSENKTTSGW